ncbi:hypothetical protein HZA45_01250 [Candidatus Peregrinibacteria bacterium]|nr:hypothetical protein [Candidatus Peregrinibacteria bacterium]
MERFPAAVPLSEILQHDTEYVLAEPVSVTFPINRGRATSTLKFHKGDRIHLVEGDTIRGYLIGIFGKATKDRICVSPADVERMKVHDA